MELEDKVVLITGGGTGIGKATALKVADAGAKVVVNYSRSEKEAEEVVKEIIQQGGKAFSVKANVANEKEVNDMGFPNHYIVWESRWFSQQCEHYSSNTHG